MCHPYFSFVSGSILYSAGTPGSPAFIRTGAGTSGTFLGTQLSTTQAPQITGGYIGGTSVNSSTPIAIQQIYLQSSASGTATYLVGARDTSGSGPYYSKMVQVIITLDGNKAYARAAAARYHITALTTGPSTNILTLWNAGTSTTVSTSGAGYGVAGMTAIGF